MIRKLSFSLVIALILGTAGVSCTEDIPDCPTGACVVAGGWKLVEVLLDGEEYKGDLAVYQLTLNSPSSTTENTSTFERVSMSGNHDNGTWSLENIVPDSSTPFKGGILRLTPSGDLLLQEDWNIESFTPRQMVLVMNRDTSVKDGPATIRFILKPF